MRRNLATFVNRQGVRYFYAPPIRKMGKSVFNRKLIGALYPVPQDIEPHVSVRNMNAGRT
jgi:hypothetical protein